MTAPISLATAHQSSAFATTKALQSRHGKGSGAVQFSLPPAQSAAKPQAAGSATGAAGHGNLVNGSLLATLSAQSHRK